LLEAFRAPGESRGVIARRAQPYAAELPVRSGP
jgi:hypothetical protein